MLRMLSISPKKSSCLRSNARNTSTDNNSASSRWKNIRQIDMAGHIAVEDCPDVEWWEQNWRKGGLQMRRNELLHINDFYNQLYCGCEFSLASSSAMNKETNDPEKE